MLVNYLKIEKNLSNYTNGINLLLSVKRKNKGISIFYNTKLNAVSGLSSKNLFETSKLRAFLLKKRQNSLKYLIEFQTQSFQNLLILKRKTNIFLKNINSYKGVRLELSLPLRGQRTHTNSKTARKLNKL